MRTTAASLLVILATCFPLSSYTLSAQEPPYVEGPRKDEQRIHMEKDMAKRANQQRQQEIRRDSEQLLKLAAELKQCVDKSNENVLSMDVVRKADEIEKLAHSVKEKMKSQ